MVNKLGGKILMANTVGSNTEAYTLRQSNRPPFFNGKYYNYWKERMKFFVQSVDYNLWKIIMNGPQIPTKTGVDGVVTLKTEGEWNEDDTKKVELNAKAVNMLYCAISLEEYRKILRCKTAKEIWDKLQIIHEGTTQVMEMRIDMLRKEYEMFSMKERESINDMFERFSIIINSLDAMEITHSEEMLVRKVLRSLTKEWKTKVTVISKSSNLSQMTYDELREKLLAYEIIHIKNDTKKKGVNLKSYNESLDDESSDLLSDDDFVVFVRELKKMVRLKEKNKGGNSKESKKDKVICRNCIEVEHYKYDCPRLKKEDKSRKDKKKGLKPIASFDMRNDRDRTRGCDGGGSFGKDKIDALSRLLTRILRHMASELNLDMQIDGYVKVNDLLKLNMKTFANIPLRSHNIDDVREAVRKDNKQRFSLIEENGELLIRANQGHTIMV
ncbi:uncharacterized protein LOC130960821 [Arachis stenosperma]|uniref:uncharacterized protein LOC130960821 n=1 Tax=Arachis stenosperma TaxID=217475 RepID=UPI0025ABDCA1|nr:uncharacterized protein LOC130960821 [Arachis stenosperma]